MKKSAFPFPLQLLLGATPLLAMAVLFGGCPRSQGGMPQGDFNTAARPPVVTPKTDPNAPFTVLHLSPGGEEETDPATSLLVYFSEPVVDLHDGEQPPQEVLSLSPAAPGKARWLGSSLVEFTPQAPLRRNTRYEVVFAPTLKSRAGKPLTVKQPFAFETTRVRVSHFWGTRSKLVQDDYDPPVSGEGPFYVRFNQPVNPQALRPLMALNGEPVNNLEALAETKNAPAPKEGAVLLRFSPARPVPLGKKITLTIQQGQFATEGPLPLASRYESTLATPDRFALSFTTPDHDYCDGSFSIYANRRVSEKVLRQNLSVTPPAPLREPTLLGPDREYFYPYWFEPGQTYKVTVSGNLKATTGETLGEDLSASFTMPNDSPNLGFKADQLILEKNLPPTVALMRANVGAVDLFAAPLNAGQAMSWFKGGGQLYPNQPFTSLHPSPFNEFLREPVDLSGVTGQSGPVLVMAKSAPAHGACEVEHQDKYEHSALVQRTNLAITTKLHPTGATAWVTTLDKGQPVGGALVAAYDEKGQRLGQGRSSNLGLAVLSLSPDADEEVAFFRVSKGQDSLISRAGWNEGLRSYEWGLEDWRVAEGTHEGHFVLERDLYRPGETVRFALIVRRRHGNDLKTPHRLSVDVKVNDPDGEVLATLHLKTDEFGMASGSFAATSGLEGYLGLEAQVDKEWMATASVRLTSFRPIAFETQVKGPEHLVWGKEAVADVNVRYLAGAPMGGGPVELTLTRQPGAFTDPDGEDFSYNTWAWWDEPYLDSYSTTVLRQTLITDNQGEARFTFTPKREKAGNEPVDYTLEATGQDQSYQRVSARQVMRAHPAEAYVGLRLKNWFVREGDPLLPEVKVVSPQGKKLGGQPVALTLERLTWQVVKTISDWGEVSYENKETATVVDRCTAKSQGCKLRAAKAGEYRINAVFKGRQGVHRSSVWVYVFGKSQGQVWAAPDHNRVDLVLDKKEYHPGQTASVLFKNPFPTASALLTVETNKVLTRRVLTLTAPMVRLNVPITQAMAPGAYVSLFAVQGRTGEKLSKTGVDIGKPTYRMALAQLKVSPEGRELKVALKHPATVKPGATIPLTLTLRHKNGKPCACQAAVMVVDEAVLKLTGFSVANPMNTFFTPQPHGVNTATSLMHVVGREHYGRKGHNPGGDGKGSGTANLRADFRLSAYFNPAVRANSQGVARLNIALPQSLTSYRIMVVALSREDHFGLGRGNVRTQLPLMVRPALPKFVRRGDVVDVAFTVQQTGRDQQTATLNWSMKGGKWLEEPPTRVSLAKNTATRVSAWLQPTGENLTLGLSAQADGNRDGAVLTLPVRPGLDPRVVTTRQLFEKSTTLTTMPSAFVRAEKSSASVQVSLPLVAGLKRTTDVLLPYPYDCLEQRTSKLQAFLSLTQLEKVLGRWITPKQRQQFLTDLHKFSDYQSGGSGLWALWPKSWEGSPYHTARALRLLHEAQSLKLYKGPRPTRQIDALWAWLSREIKQKPWPDAHLEALLALRAWGKPHQAMESRYALAPYQPQGWKRLGLSQKLNVLRVLRASRPGAAAGLFSALSRTATAKQKPGAQLLSWEAYGGWDYWCETCGLGAMLDGLLDFTPTAPLTAQTALALQDELVTRRWLTTYESAAAMGALGRFALLTRQQVGPLKEGTWTAQNGPMALGTVAGQRYLLGGEAGFAKLGEAPWNLTVATPNNGPLLASATWRVDRGFHYSPAEEHGMVLGVSLQNQKGGGGLSAGQKVNLKLLMASPQPRRQVVVEIPLPSGVEPIDLSLSTSEQQDEDEEEEEEVYDPWCDCYRSKGSQGQRASQRLSPWNIQHTGFYDDRVVLVLNRLGAGVTTYTLPALALNAGRFQVSEATLSPMYLPHVYGRTGSQLVTVDR